MKKTLSPQDIIRSGMCIGCGSCVAQAGQQQAKMEFDAYGELKPHGASEWLRTRSDEFTRTCPFSPAAKNENELAANLYPEAKEYEPHLGRYLHAYVGYVSEGEYRLRGSSGGMVSWVAAELMRQGMIDGLVHVVANEDPQTSGRYFQYRISRNLQEVQQGAKSRYYPIELSGVLDIISMVPGRYAVVGIPCFIKAIHLLREEYPLLKERIPFTLGLFCGHMKSARFIESFAWQMDLPREKVKQVEFRHKDPSRPANWYNARLTAADGTVVNRDWWHLADGDWGAGYFMNHACNYCDDVIAETADISFGDAWLEPYSSDGRGTNVVVVRSGPVQLLIDQAMAEGRLQLQEVDHQFVVQTQAAGFRQRREGLAYRLTWAKKGVQPLKRVGPDSVTPTRNRKLIYRMRYFISEGSHRFFRLARKMNKPGIYIKWARTAGNLYHGLAYQRGKVGEWVKKLKLTDNS